LRCAGDTEIFQIQRSRIFFNVIQLISDCDIFTLIVLVEELLRDSGICIGQFPNSLGIVYEYVFDTSFSNDLHDWACGIDYDMGGIPFATDLPVFETFGTIEDVLHEPGFNR
jgi:hypothetical protein